MNDQLGWNLTIQQINIFLQSVALRNFTKVATALNFTPSMISKTIMTIEKELDMELFIRKPHELTPTAAALLLAEEWRQFTGSFDNSIKKVKTFIDEQTYRILLGFVDSSDQVDRLMKQLILDHTKKNPQINIISEKHDMHRSVELLHFGMLDLAITNEIELPYIEEHHLCWEKLMTTNVTAFVPGNNPLFKKDHITFLDLKDQPLLGLDAKMHPGYNKWLYDLCKQNGFIPNIENHYRTVRSLMFGLELKNDIFIGDSITSDWAGENLKAFDLGVPSYALIVYRKDASPIILNFKNYVINKFKQ